MRTELRQRYQEFEKEFPTIMEDSEMQIQAADYLLDNTQKYIDPLLKSFPNIKDIYLDLLINHAVSFRVSLLEQARDGKYLSSAKQSQYFEDAVENIIESLKTKKENYEASQRVMIINPRESSRRKWPELNQKAPDFIKNVEDLLRFAENLYPDYDSHKNWLEGLIMQTRQVEIWLNQIEKNPESITQDKINNITIDIIEDTDRVFPHMNDSEEVVEKAKKGNITKQTIRAPKRTLEVLQGRFITYLENQGITRVKPDLGSTFDYKWQEAIGGSSGNEKISQVLGAAYFSQVGESVYRYAKVYV